MILVIDAGNTNIVLGCMDGSALRFTARIRTDRAKTEDEYVFTLIEKADSILEKLQSINVRNVLTINRLIEVALGLSSEVGASQKRQYDPLKYTRKLLNLLYKSNKQRFLDNFIVKNAQNMHD